MNKGAQRETLSAMLDDEAAELEARQVLRDFSPGDAETWSRWQLARDLIQGHDTVPVPADFAARLTQSLGPQAPARPRWLGAVVRTAVAASVAAATVIGWQFYAGAGGQVGAASQLAATPAQGRLSAPVGERSLVAEDFGPRRQGQKVSDTARHREQLNSMLVRHSDLAARHSQQGLMPYARLVSLEAGHGAR